MNDLVSHPKHYTQGIECWDYITSHKMGYLEGNIIKYVTRYKQKDGLKDLLKAQAYLGKLISEMLPAKKLMKPARLNGAIPLPAPELWYGFPLRDAPEECQLDGRNCAPDYKHGVSQCCGHPERGICAGNEKKQTVVVGNEWPSRAECACPLDISGELQPAPNDTESYCLGDFHRIADWMKKAWINE